VTIIGLFFYSFFPFLLQDKTLEIVPMFVEAIDCQQVAPKLPESRHQMVLTDGVVLETCQSIIRWLKTGAKDDSFLSVKQEVRLGCLMV